MKPRMNPFAVAPQIMQAMLDMESKTANSGLDETIRHLVKIRASQINGCAYCIHMHTREARAHGETEERIYLLDGWRESPLYTDRERAALGWTEALTLVAQTRAPDTDYEALKAQFSDEEIVKLTLVITTINAWNRISVGFRSIHPVEAVHAAA
ncbi:carboxymuconolactone decarboxylase family protein [Phyllobacterium salinisoli]|uniref:Carboxymuconolactone decarboxylase family protein n=1 Tax=Phyllobacterium salinisoli TaxID=1899321 RepID=A0A368K5Z8_9HYPH|nr:carboxymuconolactone decarboxylase family protein [Phyllobacterium salinisoli]RCS24818.1 carboxymuconolactone decarboxylase family protein [Phyllobacterium salinisoli]